MLWNFCGSWVNWSRSRRLGRALQKSLLGHVTVFPPYLVLFLASSTALEWLQDRYLLLDTLKVSSSEGSNGLVAEVGSVLREKTLPLFVTGGLFWPAVNAANFLLFPSGVGRIVFLNLNGLAWNGYLSWQMAHRRLHGNAATANGDRI
ncbi:hypothetical protein BC828DRAFT_404893 [Blastocladiella britannica]|nr:hypothetical protein BC828DRAFT_404893 [Blastocladiella britannica]